MTVLEDGLSGRFVDGVHVLPVRIYYEDTDFTGVVYHANYVRYFERGRSAFLAAAGITHTELAGRDEPMAFTIRRIELDFRAPARIDDTLKVVTRYQSVAGARIIIAQEIHRGVDLLVSAQVEAACISMAGRPRRMPADIMERLRPFIGGGGD